MLDINIDQIRHFLEIITDKGQVTFQTFDDSKDKRKKLSKIIHGWNQENLDTITTLNNQGAGIFLMVNKGDGNGRSSENVTEIRAFFVDLDGSPLEPVLESGLTPHLTIESSPNRFHAYWLVSDAGREQFSPIQKALADKFNADKSVHDLPRVMRVPGFYHHKGEAFRCRILSSDQEQPAYSVENFKKFITPDTATKRIITRTSIKGERHDDLKKYIVGRLKAGLDPKEVRILVESWVREHHTDAKSHDDLLKWAEEHINPDSVSGRFGDLVRVKSEPVSWRLKVDGQEIEISSTKDLDSYPSLRRLIMEQLGTVPPVLSAKKWNIELEKLMEHHEAEDMPDDVSVLGMAWGETIRYLNSKFQGKSKDDLLMNRPWRDEKNSRVYLKTSDLHLFLQQRGMKIEPRKLGGLLRKHSGKNTSLYIKGMNINVWWIPIEEADQGRQTEDFDPVEFQRTPF